MPANDQRVRTKLDELSDLVTDPELREDDYEFILWHLDNLLRFLHGRLDDDDDGD